MAEGKGSSCPQFRWSSRSKMGDDSEISSSDGDSSFPQSSPSLLSVTIMSLSGEPVSSDSDGGDSPGKDVVFENQKYANQTSESERTVVCEGSSSSRFPQSESEPLSSEQARNTHISKRNIMTVTKEDDDTLHVCSSTKGKKIRVTEQEEIHATENFDFASKVFPDDPRMDFLKALQALCRGANRSVGDESLIDVAIKAGYTFPFPIPRRPRRR